MRAPSSQHLLPHLDPAHASWPPPRSPPRPLLAQTGRGSEEVWPQEGRARKKEEFFFPCSLRSRKKKMGGVVSPFSLFSFSFFRRKKEKTYSFFCFRHARRRPDRGGPRRAGGPVLDDGDGDDGDDKPLARRHDDDLGPSRAGAPLVEPGGIGAVCFFFFGLCCFRCCCCCSRRCCCGACHQGPAHEGVPGVPVR